MCFFDVKFIEFWYMQIHVSSLTVTLIIQNNYILIIPPCFPFVSKPPPTVQTQKLLIWSQFFKNSCVFRKINQYSLIALLFYVNYNDFLQLYSSISSFNKYLGCLNVQFSMPWMEWWMKQKFLLSLSLRSSTEDKQINIYVL